MAMLNMGGLPSEHRYYDFKGGLIFRPLIVADAPAISFVKDLRRPMDVHCLLQSVLQLTSEQIWDLTVDDCTYILSYIKAVCYTDAPITVTWDCKHNVVTHRDKRLEFHDDKKHLSDKELRALDLHRRSCYRKNTELIYPRQQNVIYDEPDWSYALPEHLKIPRLRDLFILSEAEDLPSWKSYAGFADALLWCVGESIQEKLTSLTELGIDVFDIVDEARSKLSHGITSSYILTCFDCGNKPVIENKLSVYDVLPAIDSTSLMNMQYTLMGKMSVVTSEDLPLQKLLFWHSAYLKDKQAKQAARNLNAAKRNK